MKIGHVEVHQTRKWSTIPKSASEPPRDTTDALLAAVKMRLQKKEEAANATASSNLLNAGPG